MSSLRVGAPSAPNIIYLINNKSFDEVVKAIRQFPDLVNFKDRIEDRTPLMKAIELENWELFEFLLANNVAINAMNDVQENALMFCGKNQRVDMMSRLLDLGADVNAIDISKFSAAFHGVRSKHNPPSHGHNEEKYVEMIMLLCDHPSVDIHQRHLETGESFLSMIAEQGLTDCVKKLIERGVNVNGQNRWGRTAVTNACAKGHVDTACLLAECGADIYLARRDEKKSIDYIIDREKKKCVLEAAARGKSDLEARTLLENDELLLALAKLSYLSKIGVCCHLVRKLSVSSLDKALMIVNVVIDERERTSPSKKGLYSSGMDFSWTRNPIIEHLSFEGISISESILSNAILNLAEDLYLKSIDFKGVSLSISQAKQIFDALCRNSNISKIRCHGFGLDFEELDRSILEDDDSMTTIESFSSLSEDSIRDVPFNAAVAMPSKHYCWLVDANYWSFIGEDEAKLDLLGQILCQWPDLLVSTNSDGFQAVLIGGGELSPVNNTFLKTISRLLKLSYRKESITASFFTHIFYVDKLPYSIFTVFQHAFWFFLLSQDQFADKVQDIAKKDRHLLEAKDFRGRDILAQATVKCKQFIMSLTLIYERFFLSKLSPEHQSESCRVYLATDELSTSRRSVALKFMKTKEAFLGEIGFRAKYKDLESNSILPLYSLKENDYVPATYMTNCEIGYGRVDCLENAKDYPYCVVLPAADRNLCDIISHEVISNPDMQTWRVIARDIVKGVQFLHSKGFVHGDLKPMNIMRSGPRYYLIDLDNSTLFKQPMGRKVSSAYMPPEMIYWEDTAAADPVVSSMNEENSMGLDGEWEGRTARIIPHPSTISTKSSNSSIPVMLADPSYDQWCLGAVLYQVFTGESLFHHNSSDMLDQNHLRVLGHWNEETKYRRLLKIVDEKARNLVSRLLMKDPKSRIDSTRALKHPFFTGKSVVRMVGESAKYDVFLSYRVRSDAPLVEKIYQKLVNECNLRVFWDKIELEDGVSWEDGFCNALAQCDIFVPILSLQGLFAAPGTNGVNINELTATSPPDNVLLEYRLALEFQQMELISLILPCMVGLAADAETSMPSRNFSNQCHCHEIIHSIDKKLFHHLDRLSLGFPMQPHLSVADILDQVLKCQGIYWNMSKATDSLIDELAAKIMSNVEKLRFKANGGGMSYFMGPLDSVELTEPISRSNSSVLPPMKQSSSRFASSQITKRNDVSIRGIGSSFVSQSVKLASLPDLDALTARSRDFVSASGGVQAALRAKDAEIQRLRSEVEKLQKELSGFKNS